MNKILLINTLPTLNYWERSNNEPMIGIPYGLLSIGTCLTQKGYEVIIVDPIVEKDYFDIIRNNIDKCLFAGISAMTSGIASGLKIATFIRKLNPKIPIVWGGVHPTLFPEETLVDSLVDIVVWGEGEETCLELANALKNNIPLSSVKGIGFKTESKELIFSPRRNFLDINKLPFIDFNLVNMEQYLYRDLESLSVGFGRIKIITLHSSRGCPFNCIFCINTHPSQKYRQKSYEKLSKEVEVIVKKYNPDVIYFQDDNFFANKQRVFQFFEEYKNKEYSFKWFTLVHASYFNDKYLSSEFVSKIRDSCLWLGIGVESGSDRIRKLLKKNITKEQVLRAAGTLAKSKIPAGYAFMVGLPFEKDEDIFETVSFIFQIKKIHHQAQFAYQCYRPYPGSELYNLAIERGYNPPISLRGWTTFQNEMTGYSSSEKLPWIKSPKFIDYLITAVYFATSDPKLKEINKALLHYFFKFSLKIRTRYKLKGFIIELSILNTAIIMKSNVKKLLVIMLRPFKSTVNKESYSCP